MNHKNLQTDFVWDGSHLIQEQSGENRYTYIYTHPESYEPLAQIQVAKNGEKQTAYYHCDQIGIPRELTNEKGELCWYASYKGWGELQGEHNLKGIHQPLRLQNQYADKETGLHYNFFRYYEPTVGRFINQDPIGLAGGENLYRFESTVQNQIDPLGLFAIAIPWVISGLEYVVSAVAGLMIGAAIVESTKDNSKEKEQSCSKNICPPCQPYPVGTVGYQGPKSATRGMHGTRAGTGELHYILFEVQQLPYEKGCKCRWQETNRIAGHHYMHQPNSAFAVDLNGKGRPPAYP
ncbi:RHS repeat-associated core domain-containing protein [Muribacter muris]|uniref:RHS repeat-associated core domain-containing protein n=1 Tax=Muribacter muris TaxID=67855 RepID=UPI001D16E6AE|nr:RHS repeat-associated core domain-containing protein [Muribacter muris]